MCVNVRLFFVLFFILKKIKAEMLTNEYELTAMRRCKLVTFNRLDEVQYISTTL